MPQIIDLNHSEDPRDIIHRAVQALAEGKLVGFASETNYIVAAYSLRPEAVQKLGACSHPDHPPARTLALKSPLEALDYVRNPGKIGEKLIRRCWPGPVTLLFPVSEDSGILDSLPPEVRQLIIVNGELPCRVVGEEVLQAVQRLLPAPLIISSDFPPNGTPARTAAELAKSHSPEISQSPEIDLIIDHGPCRYSSTSTIVRINDLHWEILHEGVVNERTIRRLLGDVYLFVCTGNTCRSPMAEALFRKLVADKLGCSEEELTEKGFVSVSAGLAAYPGSGPSPEAVEVLKLQGIDLSPHESQPLTPRLLSQADYVFTMTKSHRDTILWEYPELSHQVSLLSREDRDVADPIGGTFEDYALCADEIATNLRAILQDIEL